MYEYFYLAMLIGAILLCFTAAVGCAFGKKHMGIWGKMVYGLATITMVALIGFAVTLPWGS